MAKCPDCENGRISVIDNGPPGLSLETWGGLYPKDEMVDCATCEGYGEVFDIPASCHSDDHRIEIDFDAVGYFQQCSASEIAALIQCDWRSDYPADAVAQHFRETTTSRLFDYLDLIGGMDLRDSSGFECSVDEDAAITWLEKTRPKKWGQAQEIAFAAEEAPDAAIAVEPKPETVWGETIDWGGNGDA